MHRRGKGRAVQPIQVVRIQPGNLVAVAHRKWRAKDRIERHGADEGRVPVQPRKIGGNLGIGNIPGDARGRERLNGVGGGAQRLPG